MSASKPKTIYAELTEEEVLEIAKEIEVLTPGELDMEIARAAGVELKRKESMKKTRAKYEARHKLLIAKAKEMKGGLIRGK